jgi:hypothetical protein
VRDDCSRSDEISDTAVGVFVASARELLNSLTIEDSICVAAGSEVCASTDENVEIPPRMSVVWAIAELIAEDSGNCVNIPEMAVANEDKSVASDSTLETKLLGSPTTDDKGILVTLDPKLSATLLTELSAEDIVGSAVISEPKLETIPLASVRTGAVEAKGFVS